MPRRPVAPTSASPRRRFARGGRVLARLRAAGPDRQGDRRRRARLEALLAASPDATVIVDRHGRVTYASPTLDRWLGGDDAIGRSLAAVLDGEAHPEDAGRAARFLARLDEPAGETPTTLRLRRADGSWRDVELSGRDLTDDERVGGRVVQLRDVSRRAEVERTLRHQASHDALTGLACRTLFGERLARAATASGRVAVLFLDLDDFKGFNDALGHSLADELLVRVARRVRDAAERAGADTVARLGGDEFTVLLTDVRDEVEALRIGRTILAALEAPVELEGQALKVDASIGVVVGAAADCADDLLRSADHAMYAAKTAGKRRVQLYDPRMHAGRVHTARLRADLRAGIESGALELHYQPVVALATGAVLGLEALVRWRHPTRGLLLPATFIDAAERSGLIVPLGRAVLDEACRVVRELQERRPEHGQVRAAVNVSAAQLADDGLAGDVAAALGRSGLAPGLLVLELTESVLLGTHDDALERLRALKQLGVQLAVDDFGTGYSSLAYLLDYPFDIVKIDRRLVQDVGRRPVAREVARAVLGLAGAVGLDVVAEGIEEDEQARVLQELGCRIGQGYRFGRPMPLEHVDAYLGGARARPAARAA